MKYALLYDTPEGGNAVVVCNSHARAEQVREVMENKGATTRGIIPVTPAAQAIVEAGR